MFKRIFEVTIVTLGLFAGIQMHAQAGGGSAGRDFNQTKCCSAGGYNVELSNCQCAVITGAGDTCGGMCATGANAVAQSTQQTEVAAPEPAPVAAPVVVPVVVEKEGPSAAEQMRKERLRRQRQARRKKKRQAARKKAQQAKRKAAQRTQIDTDFESESEVNYSGKQWIGPKEPIVVGGGKGRARGDEVTFNLQGIKVKNLSGKKGTTGFVDVPKLGEINAYKYNGITIVIASFDLKDQSNNPTHLNRTIRQIIDESSRMHPDAFGMVMVARQLPGEKSFGVAMEVFVSGNSEVMGQENAIPYKAIDAQAIQFTTPADASSEAEDFVINFKPIAKERETAAFKEALRKAQQ